MPFKQTPQQQADNITRSIITRLGRKLTDIQRTAETASKGAYSKFSRQPYDTGESYRNTLANVATGTNFIIIRTFITTSYAKYFMFGLGSNAKYGERNVLTKAEPDILEKIKSIL